VFAVPPATVAFPVDAVWFVPPTTVERSPDASFTWETPRPPPPIVAASATSVLPAGLALLLEWPMTTFLAAVVFPSLASTTKSVPLVFTAPSSRTSSGVCRP